jgi:hypothetical protein
MQKHNASLLDILRGSIIIPGELLSSRAHFRLMNSDAKLNRNLYIYNLSKIREGYSCSLHHGHQKHQACHPRLSSLDVKQKNSAETFWASKGHGSIWPCACIRLLTSCIKECNSLPTSACNELQRNGRPGNACHQKLGY